MTLRPLVLQFVRRTFGIRDPEESKAAAVMTFVMVAAILAGTGLIDLAFQRPFVWIAAISSDQGSYLLHGVLPPVMLLIAFLLRITPARQMRWLAATLCNASALFIGYISILVQTHDFSAQVFYCAAILFASYSLTPLAAWINCFFTMSVNGAVLAMFSNTYETWNNFVAMHCIVLGVFTATIISRNAQASLQKRLEQRASEDALTGLLNRQELDKVLPQPDNFSTPGVALLAIDIDNFKGINDNYGHPFGDYILEKISQAVAVLGGDQANAYRLGGDELMCFIDPSTLAEATSNAKSFVELIRDTEFRTPAGQKVPVTVSVGVAHWPTHLSSGTCLYTIADHALYHAKAAGRDQYAVPPPADQHHALKTMPAAPVPAPASGPRGGA